MAGDADFYSVKLTQDIDGGYGSQKAGATLENLPKYQADHLHNMGWADAPKPQEGPTASTLASGTTVEAAKKDK